MQRKPKKIKFEHNTDTVDKYFANLSTKDIGTHLMEKIEQYYYHCHITGRLDSWFRSYEMYHAGYLNGSRIHVAGENDEYVTLGINHYKNILKHMHNNVTSMRIAFEPHATNTDTKSQAQTLLAIGLLDYYLREKKMNRFLKDADLSAMLYGEGFVGVDWDALEGDVVSYETDDKGEQDDEKAIHEGDVIFRSFTPNNVIRDPNTESWAHVDWVITRDFTNKYALAARYPDYAEKIVAVDGYKSRFQDRLGEIDSVTAANSDEISLYTLYHRKCPAVPEGRMIRFLDSNLMLTDNALPFTVVPVFRETPEEQDGTPFGTTIAFDLMPIQESLDMIYSQILTNQKAFGVQCIAVARGSNLEAGQIAEGLTVIEYTPTLDGGKPEPLNLLATAPETFKFIEILERQMETISGINSVIRGNPEASLQSGAALALVHSTSIQFSMDQQASYSELIQDVGTCTINILKEFVNTDRVITIAGRSNKSYLRHFNNDDISDISRVTIDVGNPLTRTTAGKIQLAETLLQNEMIKTPEEYLMVLQTGKLEPLMEGETAELMLIRGENEALAEGKEMTPLLTDNHDLHIREHKAVLASPEAREDAEIVELTLAHIQGHINLLSDPDNVEMLQMLGQQPFQSAPPQGAPEGGDASMDPAAQQGMSAPADEASMPNMPNLPDGENGQNYDPSIGETL